MKRRLGYYGLPLGWVFGMLTQIVLLQFLVEKLVINKSWWITQLIGLAVVTTIWIILDRKVVVPWVKTEFVPWVNTIWNLFLNWLKT